MSQLRTQSTQCVNESSRVTPLRVVAVAVLMAIGIGGSGLVYCYLTTPLPVPTLDTMLFPRLPMHPF